MMVAEIDRFVAAHIGVVDGAQRNDAQRCRQSGCRDYDIRVIWPHEGEPGQVGIVGINAGEPIDAAVVVWTETERDRKSVVEGKSVSVRVDLGGRRIIKKKK